MTAELSNIDSDTRNLIRAIVQETVPEVVKHTFGNLGLDVSTTDAKIAAQRDFSYVREKRLSREKLWETASTNLAKMVMTALAIIGVLGLVAWLKDKGGIL